MGLTPSEKQKAYRKRQSDEMIAAASTVARFLQHVEAGRIRRDWDSLPEFEFERLCNELHKVSRLLASRA